AEVDLPRAKSQEPKAKKESPMSQSAQKNSTGFTTVQAYTLAVITLVIGITVGYFARGSAGAPVAESAQAAAPAAAAPMGSAELPGIGSQQQQQAVSPEELTKAAAPMLAQLQQNPRDFETLAKIGNLYYDGQAYPQAIEYYEKALAIQPD